MMPSYKYHCDRQSARLRLEQIVELVFLNYASKLESTESHIFTAMKHSPNLTYEAFARYCHAKCIDFSDQREVK